MIKGDELDHKEAAAGIRVSSKVIFCSIIIRRLHYDALANDSSVQAKPSELKKMTMPPSKPGKSQN
jgi:hypothetical protein